MIIYCNLEICSVSWQEDRTKLWTARGGNRYDGQERASGPRNHGLLWADLGLGCCWVFTFSFLME